MLVEARSGGGFLFFSQTVYLLWRFLKTIVFWSRKLAKLAAVPLALASSFLLVGEGSLGT